MSIRASPPRVGPRPGEFERPALGTSDFGPATFVPLAGPWIQLGLTQSVGDDWWAPWQVFSGMTHTGSLLFVILGLVLTKRVAASADLGNGVHLAVSRYRLALGLVHVLSPSPAGRASAASHPGA